MRSFTNPPQPRVRRGQIQFGETIMVVVVLVFLLVIGMVFYFNAAKQSVHKTIGQANDVASLQLAKNILSLPEVGCNPLEASGTCVDKLKLDALADIITCGRGDPPSRYYCHLFGYANITLTYVTGNPGTVPLYSSVPRNASASDPQFIFTTIYDPLTRMQRFAYLNVTRYTAGVSFS